jgi:HrpA-like RNA helicase
LKLFSSRSEAGMKTAAEPELMRVPLEDICLTVLASGLAKSCKQFLSLTPEPPEESAIDFALEGLRSIGAIECSLGIGDDPWTSSFETLTPLGVHLTKIPIDARLGKMLIFGAIFKCLAPALTIAAFLSSTQSPFASSVTEMNVAKAKHAAFFHPSSDFISLLNVWEAYRQSIRSGSTRLFCRENFLNHRALIEIGEAREQFLNILFDIGFVRREEVAYDRTSRRYSEATLDASTYCSNIRKEEVIHALVCAGLYPNVAGLCKQPESRRGLWHKSEQLVIHSTSVNSRPLEHPPSSWIAFNEKLGTGRRVSISTTCYIHPFSLMIFGCAVKVLHTERKVSVDDWIELDVAAKTGVMFREVRDHVDRFLNQYVQSILQDDTSNSGPKGSQVIDRIVDLLSQAH